jgi:hypothetical protein
LQNADQGASRLFGTWFVLFSLYIIPDLEDGLAGVGHPLPAWIALDTVFLDVG